jgi:tRNA(Ile)-lysidine synthase
MDDVLKRLENYILTGNLVTKGDKILLSLSAGKDSIFLLEQFCKLREIFNIEIAVFHLNHQMRGKESDLDEEFIVNASSEKNLKVYNEKFDFSINNKKSSFEERAREIRYKMLNEISVKYGYNKIATAHTLNDNAETVLMRIFTGTGVFGLKGISPARENIIRPLLFLKSEEIIEYLRFNKIFWREDSSNSDTDYLRNYIRNKIIPLIENKIPQAVESVLKLSKISGEHYSILEKNFFSKIELVLSENRDALAFKTENFTAGEIKAALDYFSRIYFKQYLNESILEECSKKYFSGKKNIDMYSRNNFSISKAFADGSGMIKIANIAGKKILDWNYRINISDIKGIFEIFLKEPGLSFDVYFTDFNDFRDNYKNNRYIFVTIPGKQIQINFRSRNKGDYIELDFGRKKIKDLLIEKKLDNKIKNYVPLLVLENEIAAFMPGFLNHSIPNRVSRNFSVKPDSGQILAIKLR